jgi:Dolichyl-phosphate-mannose-protein mannosyltransferase
MSVEIPPSAVMPIPPTDTALKQESSHRAERAIHRLRRFRFDRPQRYAALLLLLLMGQCLWQIGHIPLTQTDYQYARCGREMWERPSPIAGYFTTCGNIHDGVLAYRMAGLPLTLQRLVTGQSSDTSTWEMRHELSFVRLLLRFPFTMAALLLGGALWWVTRRLFGNMGGFVALALYCVSPAIVAAGSQPNAEITTALGIFAVLYTAMGVAHAMHGPRRKWRPRIVLLAAGLGLVAASHSAALLLTLPLAAIFMIYLAERNRTAVPMVIVAGTVGAFVLLFACYAFHPDAVSYYFRSGAGRLGWDTMQARMHLFSLGDAGIAIALAAALVLYVGTRRSRYFGNTAPLLIALCLMPLITTGSSGQPWLWGLPFLLTFIAGVFADALETKHGRVFRWAVVAMVVLQAVLTTAFSY